MKKKWIMWLLKLLPLFTLYKGLTSGSKGVGPLLNLVGVVSTKHDIGKIANLVIENYNDTNGQVVSPERFANFIAKNYENPYTSITRRIIGDHKNFGQDVWGKPFRLSYDEYSGEIDIRSFGPDSELKTNDDISVSFKVTPVNQQQNAQNVYQPQRAPAQVYIESEYDEDGFDREGFDSEGYDREGFNREGYDREGYDYHGLNRDGYERP